MGFYVERRSFDGWLQSISDEWEFYAPVIKRGEGTFSDTDIVRYDRIHSIEEIEWERKSDYSFKEILLPITQRLFYFTENVIKEADVERQKHAVIFLRSCDLHALKRLDEIYLRNGGEDYYYRRLRENLKVVLMGCSHSFENCFCVSMGTNVIMNYDLAVNMRKNGVEVDSRWDIADQYFANDHVEEDEFKPDHVSENEIQVHIPDGISQDIFRSNMWEEYDSRCINCGRCNFVCPTCTCFTMQDIFYQENGRVGERRRVHASCMVDGFTDVAGGGAYRKKNGERMRFKVLHKVYDYEKRFGYHMCVGCGRCDDVCPEYISFSNCINKLNQAVKEEQE